MPPNCARTAAIRAAGSATSAAKPWSISWRIAAGSASVAVAESTRNSSASAICLR
jgi:hypothetical protein